MKEIIKLQVTREQLAEPHFYYSGCECSDISSPEEEQIYETVILDMAADVLLNILVSECKEG